MIKLVHIMSDKLFVILIIIFTISCGKPLLENTRFNYSPELPIIERPHFPKIDFKEENGYRYYEKKDYLELDKRLDFCRDTVEKYEEIIIIYKEWQDEVR